jgi:hypothetical protein
MQQTIQFVEDFRQNELDKISEVNSEGLLLSSAEMN